jgi:hypothetical protein
MATEPRRGVTLGAVRDATRWVAWALRLGWVVTAVVGASAIEAAVDDRSAAVRSTVGIAAFTGWVVGVAAMAIPSTIGLTATRAVVPGSVVVAAEVAVEGAPGGLAAGFFAAAVVTTVVALSGELGLTFVQASAYGDEQRFPLRPPVGFGIAAVVSWAAWFASIGAAPLLLAARSWIVGLLVAALAVLGTVLLPGRWHRLSVRWFVVVPAGLVLHDPVVLAETLMLRRAQVAAVRLAPADTGAADLTGPASGHAIEVATTEPVTAVFAPTPREPRGRAVHLTAFLAAPTRPGRALVAAAARVPVG